VTDRRKPNPRRMQGNFFGTAPPPGRIEKQQKGASKRESRIIERASEREHIAPICRALLPRQELQKVDLIRADRVCSSRKRKRERERKGGSNCRSAYRVRHELPLTRPECEARNQRSMGVGGIFKFRPRAFRFRCARARASETGERDNEAGPLPPFVCSKMGETFRGKKKEKEGKRERERELVSFPPGFRAIRPWMRRTNSNHPSWSK